MKVERDIKEKEAAAHLALVEEKAKRVDELEGQLVLLRMDKDELKRQIGVLNDQICLRLDGGGNAPNIQAPKPKHKRGPNIKSMANDEFKELVLEDNSISNDIEALGEGGDMFDQNMQQMGNNPLARSNTV